jgi:hypothetical protein
MATAGNAQLPMHNLPAAEPWATYPRNVASQFEGEDLERFDNFFASNGNRLFSTDKIRLSFWTARDEDFQPMNGGTEQVVNGEPAQLVKKLSIVEDDVQDAAGFDRRVKVSHAEMPKIQQALLPQGLI